MCVYAASSCFPHRTALLPVRLVVKDGARANWPVSETFSSLGAFLLLLLSVQLMSTMNIYILYRINISIISEIIICVLGCNARW
jgi:hypothetical protein